MGLTFGVFPVDWKAARLREKREIRNEEIEVRNTHLPDRELLYTSCMYASFNVLKPVTALLPNRWAMKSEQLEWHTRFFKVNIAFYCDCKVCFLSETQRIGSFTPPPAQMGVFLNGLDLVRKVVISYTFVQSTPSACKIIV